MKVSHLCAGVLLLGASGLASPASAHPHMFVDARAELVADEEGRLTGLRVSMRIDELTTLFVLEENDVARLDTPLTAEQSKAIGAGLVEGLGYYDYFADLRVDEERLTFVAATAQDVRLDGFQLAATVVLTLAAPQIVGARTVDISLYDPTFFAAVDTTDAPALPPSLAACRSRLLKFRPTELDSASLYQLSALSREETPDDPNIGAKFADRSYVKCSD